MYEISDFTYVMSCWRMLAKLIKSRNNEALVKRNLLKTYSFCKNN